MINHMPLRGNDFLFDNTTIDTNASDEVKEKLQHILTHYRVIGMNFLVIKESKEAGYGCFGYADKERKILMKKTTVFRIASISKPVVAVALLQLIEKKKCRLDDDIRAYLGFMVRNPHYKNKPLTIRHLLTHTSSLCDEGTYDSFLQSSYSDAPPPISSILKNGGIYYTKKNWKKNLPGKEFYYSNLGFGTAATIVEKVSKKRFDVFCRKHIFEPLGMHASYNVDDFENVDDFAVLYSHYNDEERTRDEFKNKQEFEPTKNAFRGTKPKMKNYHGWRPGYNAVIHSPQGGLHCSIVDLSKLMIALAGNGAFGKKRILSPHSINLMRKVYWSGTLDNGLYRETGLGLHITKNLIEGEKLYGHSGRAYGFQGMMYFNPVKKYGIIIFMNGGDYYRDEKGQVEFHNIEKELFTLLYSAYINQK